MNFGGVFLCSKMNFNADNGKATKLCSPFVKKILQFDIFCDTINYNVYGCV